MSSISDLREILFETLNRLNDKENPMEVDRAKAVAEVAQVVINSAKVEVEHLRITNGGGGTGFLGPALPAPAPAEGRPVVQRAPNGVTTTSVKDGVTITRHQIK